MKLLISINQKFMDLNPKELIKLVHEHKSKIDGFEIFFDFNKEYEINFLKKLAFESVQNDLWIQIHGILYEEKSKNMRYLDLINNISNITQNTINIVYHPIYNISKKKSEIINKKVFTELSNYILINDYKITLSLENLNDLNNQDRLNKEELVPILRELPNLKFTYDIGHEIMDCGKITDLDEILKHRLNNVHMHTFRNSIDHQIMNNKDINKEKWIKGILYLKSIKYDGTIVIEYDLYSFTDDKLENKIVSYLSSIDKIKEYFY